MKTALKLLFDVESYSESPRNRLNSFCDTVEASPRVEKQSNNQINSKIPTTKPLPQLSEGNSSPEVVDLSNITSLFELETFVKGKFQCPLRATAINTVFADGRPNDRIMVIGEAPGAEEDKQGKPFVGQSGQLLSKIFESIGLTRDQLYITNIVPWRPPGNRTPSSDEVALCMPIMYRHIELLDPKLIVLLGGVPTKALLDSKLGIMKQRGQVNDFRLPNSQKIYPCLATYHPAYLLRSPGQKRFLWQDMCLLKDCLSKLNL